ncbi:hypothetical protein, partial [Vibrio vulnificus]|uniref:hypothetical protein n=1 Tax=Vibrio vulnificus TaxID=672 RepID=UPI0039B544E2
QVIGCVASHTGRALAEYRLADTFSQAAHEAAPVEQQDAAHSALRARAAPSTVVLRARELNLKNIEVDIPRERFTVVTGVSGS